MKYIILMMVVLTGCTASLTTGRNSSKMLLGDMHELATHIKADKSSLEIPVYWTWDVSGLSEAEQAYYPGIFGMTTNHDKVVFAALMQDIVPAWLKINEYPNKTPSGDFILLIFKENKKMKKRQRVRVMIRLKNGKDNVAVLKTIRLRRHASEVNRYAYLWRKVGATVKANTR